MDELQTRLQALSEDYQTLQQDLQRIVSSRQKLEGQMQENLGVQKEFDNLGDGETIFKQLGPVLLKQNKVEAKSTVKGRLHYIGEEIARLEKQVKETQDKLDKKKTEIVQVQAAAQGPAASAGQGKAPVQ